MQKWSICLDEKLRKTVSGYKKRSFGEEMDVRCQQLMHKVEERRQQLTKEGKDSVYLREEPFEIDKRQYSVIRFI